jgi:hypothetical protein
MSLSDSRSDRRTVIDSRAALSWDSSNRVSQVPDCSVGARCPQSPREVATLQWLVASRHVLASPVSEGWPPRTSLTRPNRVHAFALRLTPLHQEASTSELLLPPLLQLHSERALTMVSSFQLTRTARLRLAHGGNRGNGDLLPSHHFRFRFYGS